ncbi:PqqD family protein [Sphingobacterium hungaricum]|uniref:PqqD family protein n=1 Tax=Sphingobacterium hungaricum TaxID=2082723 RepID=A0A928YQG3_9SPHI|nr:PqqD family protein [Sphingobacterium hungaricum]MBE8712348.1 PqqD family protein [Sphingobacterium hungaricum]
MRLRDDLTLRQIGNDYIVVDPSQDMVDMSKVYTLNETAAWLWKELKGQDFTSETMVDLLKERYEVDNEQVLKDVENLVAIFKEQGVLQNQ